MQISAGSNTANGFHFKFLSGQLTICAKPYHEGQAEVIFWGEDKITPSSWSANPLHINIATGEQVTDNEVIM